MNQQQHILSSKILYTCSIRDTDGVKEELDSRALFIPLTQIHQLLIIDSGVGKRERLGKTSVSIFLIPLRMFFQQLSDAKHLAAREQLAPKHLSANTPSSYSNERFPSWQPHLLFPDDDNNKVIKFFYPQRVEKDVSNM